MAAAMGTAILTLPAPEGNGTGGGAADQQLEQAPPKPDPPATMSTHTRAIGIIHPPPDIRVIIEKAATFVAKNGPESERRIISDNQGNHAKFNFLQPSDPYYAYYQHRVSEISAAPPGADAASGAEADAAPAEAPALAPADGAATVPADEMDDAGELGEL